MRMREAGTRRGALHRRKFAGHPTAVVLAAAAHHVEFLAAIGKKVSDNTDPED